jgi:hypothetical protein
MRLSKPTANGGTGAASGSGAGQASGAFSCTSHGRAGLGSGIMARSVFHFVIHGGGCVDRMVNQVGRLRRHCSHGSACLGAIARCLLSSERLG